MVDYSNAFLRRFAWVYVNNALSGALANIFAVSLFHPLDTARTRLQVQDESESKLSFNVVKDIYKKEGWAGLYRGWRSLVLSLLVTNFVYFYFFYGLKLNNTEEDQSIQNDFLYAFIAATIAVFISNPFWVVNTRLKLQTVKVVGRYDSFYSGIYDCFKRVRQEEGWAAFTLGLTPSLLLVSNPIINFIIYEALRRHLLVALQLYISTATLYFTFGAISKFVTTIITYPLQFIQTRLRAGIHVFEVKKEESIFRRIAHSFRGIESKLTQTVLTSALMFVFFESIRNMFKSAF